MSKIIIKILIENLPKEVLKQLLSFCKGNSLKRKSTINKTENINIEFLYDYNNEMSKIQSDAIVLHALKEDVAEEIVEREINYLKA